MNASEGKQQWRQCFWLHMTGAGALPLCSTCTPTIAVQCDARHPHGPYLHGHGPVCGRSHLIPCTGCAAAGGVAADDGRGGALRTAGRDAAVLPGRRRAAAHAAAAAPMCAHTPPSYLDCLSSDHATACSACALTRAVHQPGQHLLYIRHHLSTLQSEACPQAPADAVDVPRRCRSIRLSASIPAASAAVPAA